MTVDTEKYIDFVHGVTSTESLDYAALLTRMNKLELEDDCNSFSVIDCCTWTDSRVR